MIQFDEIDISKSSFEDEFSFFLKKKNFINNELVNTVKDIISSVRENGDESLKSLSLKFDNLQVDDFLLTKNEIEKSLTTIDKDLLSSLEYSYANILSYHSECFESLNLINQESDITRKFRPVNSVAMYIPGGQASYPSTVLMAAAPAQAAGVKEIFLTTPTVDGLLNNLTVAAASVAGVEKIYRVGGSQAIAAFALGTKQIPKVDKIIGPGNKYVAEAKRQLYGEVGIDSIAGPSEIVVLSDDTSDPELVAWDLMAQAEHDVDASSVLVSCSDKIIKDVKEIINYEIQYLERKEIIKASLEKNGLIIKIDSLEGSSSIINRLAPEHLYLAYDHNQNEEEGNFIAGLILKGSDSANSFSDYVLGPSHILPTNTSSRFSSPLSVEDFLVSYSYVSLDKTKDPKRFNEFISHTSKLAKAEGLSAHAIAAEKRLKS
tara:strand:- start:3249 stop:4547 length:1299 start_codon:yes stop_codon:yes gene_type:complete